MVAHGDDLHIWFYMAVWSVIQDDVSENWKIELKEYPH